MRLLFSASLLFVALVARADDGVVVLPLKAIGEPIAPNAQQRLRTSLYGGLTVGKLTPVDAEPSLQRVPSLRGCETAACMGKLADLAAAPYVVRSQVELVGSSSYTFTLELYSKQRNETVGKRVEQCEICNANEANEAMSHAAEQLVGDVQKRRTDGAVATAHQPSTPTSAVAVTGLPVMQRPAGKTLVAAAIGLGVTGGLAVAAGGVLLGLNQHQQSSLGGTPSVTTNLDLRTGGAIALGLGSGAILTAAIFGWWSTVKPTRSAP